jgi:ribosomal-protein-alanine N-acetyltransferase
MTIDKIYDTFPILNSDRLSFIEIKQEHLTDLFKLFGDSNVTKYYNLKTFETEQDGQKFIDWYQKRFIEKLAIRWGIALKGNNNIIGTIGFNNFTNNHRANIGYDLQTEYWNKGYVTEALKTIIDFGFNQLKINRIEAEVMIGNLASERILDKLGFAKEGVLRQWLYWNNKHYDMTMYSLLKIDVVSTN